MEKLVTGLPQQRIVEEIALDAITPGMGIIIYNWEREALVANQGPNFLLPRCVGPSTLVQLSATCPFRGSIVGIGLQATGSKTAGTVTFQAFRNGIDSGAQLVWPNATDKATVSFAKGKYPFVPNDTLDLRVSADGSFAPSGSLHIAVDLYLYVTQTVAL